MSSTSFKCSLRIEDILFALLGVATAALAGITGLVRGLNINEFDLAFVLLPVSLIVFGLSAQYAFAGSQLLASSRLVRIRKTLRDWLPFLFFLVAYEAFQSNLWTELSPVLRDAELLRIDRMMFSETPAVLMQAWTSPWLTNLLAAAYFLHIVFPAVLAFILYRKDLLTFRAFLLAVFLSSIFATIGYHLVPAVGPETAFPSLFTVDLHGNLYDSVRAVTDPLRAARDVFPSLHVGISAIVLYYGWKAGKLWFYLLLPWVLLNWVSTIYLRYHYFIDVIAGWIVAAGCIALTGVLLEAEKRWLRRGAAVG